MAAPGRPQSRTGNGWASPFGAATAQQFGDEDDVMLRSGNGGAPPLPPTMHQRRPSDPSVPADFNGFTLLTRRSKSVTLPGSGAASREGSQHEALFASMVTDVRKEESSPTAGDRGRTWNPFKRKGAAKKAAEDPPGKPAALAATVGGSENSVSRRWGRSKAPAPAVAGAGPAAAGTAVNIDVKDTDSAAVTGSATGLPQPGSERPASAPAAVKAAAGQPQQAAGAREASEAQLDLAAPGGGTTGGARWFGRSPVKAGAQPATAPAPRAADAVLKTSAVGKPDAGGSGSGTGRFGALFSGIQRTSMSKAGNGKGKGKAADESSTAGRDGGEAAAGKG